MSARAENEGIRMMEDFVCDAIHDSGIPQADPKKSGENEGMRVLEEFVFEGECNDTSENKRRNSPERSSGGVERGDSYLPSFGDHAKKR